MTPEEKKQIDEMSYQDLLRGIRFSPPGDTLFQGDTGEYYLATFKRRREEVGPAEHTRVSKYLGWER